MEVSLGTGRYAVFVALGINHSCAITNDNKQTFCWGQNSDGELGRSTPSHNNPSPLEVTVIPSNEYAIALAAGERFTCAILNDKSVQCLGNCSRRGTNNGAFLKTDLGGKKLKTLLLVVNMLVPFSLTTL